MSNLGDLSRPVKLEIGKAIFARLDERAQTGPQEEALDAYIPLLGDVLDRLGVHVEGKVLAQATQKAQSTDLEEADCDVDTWLRHHEHFVRVEANRRVGPNVARAKALYQAAFANGISHVDEYIPTENRLCREAISVLRSPMHADTVKAIALQSTWTAKWESALDKSDALMAELTQARADRKSHVDNGKDAEADLVDLLVRLRRYIASRASRTDRERWAEGQHLLSPLLEALKKARTEKTARTTRQKNAA